MHCPFCTAKDTKVIDSRLVGGGHQVRRRRECNECHERFTTFEGAELVMPRVIKQDGSREPFNEDKLLNGLTRALEKRPVSTEQVDEVVNQAKLSGEILRTIAEVITNINDMSNQIATASEQQGVVAEEININVINIHDKTQENADAELHNLNVLQNKRANSPFYSTVDRVAKK